MSLFNMSKSVKQQYGSKILTIYNSKGSYGCKKI